MSNDINEVDGFTVAEDGTETEVTEQWSIAAVQEDGSFMSVEMRNVVDLQSARTALPKAMRKYERYPERLRIVSRTVTTVTTPWVEP